MRRHRAGPGGAGTTSAEGMGDWKAVGLSPSRRPARQAGTFDASSRTEQTRAGGLEPAEPTEQPDIVRPPPLDRKDLCVSQQPHPRRGA